ncbi:MAG: cupin domain-containing protein [candidate division WOR-3 bacterium]|nr:cupin domain-containing protein [candidate division WOR-3 bacterium]
MPKIDFASLAQKLTTPWEPIEVARMNGFHILLALFHGQYKFHKHDGDEIFFVISGEIEIELENETVKLKQGEGYLLPKNTPHRSQAKSPSVVMAIERANLKTIWTQSPK